MAKRSGLAFDQDELTGNLKASAGQGMGALFPTMTPEHPDATPDFSTLPNPTHTPPEPQHPQPAGASPQERKKAKGNQRTAQPHTAQTDDPHILALDERDIEELREPAYQAQTFRLTQTEVEWIKDTAYRLSKELPRGKAAQADILRISLRLFQNLLASNRDDLLTILQSIK